MLYKNNFLEGKMSDKKSFLLYSDYIEHLECLTDEECGILMKSVFRYVGSKDCPELSGAVKMAFSFIKQQLDRDSEKYDRIVERRREAGRKGGLKKAQNNQTVANANFVKQTVANDSKAKQTVTNLADNDNDNDNVNVNDNDNVINNNINNIHSCAIKNCPCVFFDDLWELYPRKMGKKTVSKKALIAINKIGFDKMKEAIQAYKDEIKKNNIEERYVMHGSTFFNGRYVDYLDKPLLQDNPLPDTKRYGGIYL